MVLQAKLLKKPPDMPSPEPKIDSKVLDSFTDFKIDVVPVVKPVGGSDTIQTDTTPAQGGFAPPILGDEPAEITTLEDCESVSRMVWNTPGMFFGDHLLRSDEQIKIFAKELYIYCNKNDIDPRSYVMDWMPLAAIGSSMAIGMLKDHKSHKAEKKKDAAFNQPPSPSNVAFDTGKGVTGSGETTEMKELVEKQNLNPASSSGGDEITEKEV